MKGLTPRQTQILHIIQEFIEDFGMPPTRAEIARALGFASANAAEEHLRALQKNVNTASVFPVHRVNSISG